MNSIPPPSCVCHSQFLNVCPPNDYGLIYFPSPPYMIVRKLEHQSYFSLIFSPMDTPFSLFLAMFSLRIQPNRLYSPLPLVFVTASSLM